MSKAKEITKMFGTGVFGIIFFVLYLAISLTILYFGIKFVINVGDRIFSKDDKPSSSSVQQNNGDKKDLEYQESYYVGVCTEEILKRESGGQQDKIRAYCKCNYDAILAAAGSKEKFVQYQNGVSEGTIAELTTHCRNDYNS